MEVPQERADGGRDGGSAVASSRARDDRGGREGEETEISWGSTRWASEIRFGPDSKRMPESLMLVLLNGARMHECWAC